METHKKSWAERSEEDLLRLRDGIVEEYRKMGRSLPVGTQQSFNPPRVVPAIEKLKQLYETTPKTEHDKTKEI